VAALEGESVVCADAIVIALATSRLRFRLLIRIRSRDSDLIAGNYGHRRDDLLTIVR
jgi:hypothetical protein